MATYHRVPIGDQGDLTVPQPKRSRSILATVMLAICIISFVLQTELAQYVQKSTDYSKPYFILYISHSCYIFMIPLQYIVDCFQHNRQESLSLNQQIKHSFKATTVSFKHSLRELQHRIEGNTYLPIFFLIKTGFTLAILITLPSYIWYLSVNLTSMSNLTAIYNSACFFAYLFSIMMLGDSIIKAKVGAVLLCLIGVLIMALWDSGRDTNGTTQGVSSAAGIAVATLGATLYGFYEVYYKKYASPAQPTILFANMITGSIGIITLLLLWIPFMFLHVSGVETFELPDLTTFGYILAIASMSVVYNATFMAIIALVNPVFAAVGVMLTIPAVAIVDVLVTGNMVPLSTVIGSILILIGFFVLNGQIANDEKLEQELTLESQI